MKKHFLFVLFYAVAVLFITACECSQETNYITNSNAIFIAAEYVYVVPENLYLPIGARERKDIFLAGSDTIMQFTYTERHSDQQPFKFVVKTYPMYSLLEIAGGLQLNAGDSTITLWKADSFFDGDTIMRALPIGKYVISQVIDITEKSNKPASKINHISVSSKEALRYDWEVNLQNEYMNFNADSAIIRFDIQNHANDSSILIDSVIVKGTDNPYLASSTSLPSNMESHIFLNEDRNFNYVVEAFYKGQSCNSCSYTFTVHKSELLFDGVRQQHIIGIFNGFRE